MAGRPAAIFTDLLSYYEARTRTRSTLVGTPVHDALAVLRVTHPGLVAGRRRPVEIVTEGQARGMTLVDRRPHRDRDPDNCVVLEWADDAAIRDVIAAALVAI